MRKEKKRRKTKWIWRKCMLLGAITGGWKTMYYIPWAYMYLAPSSFTE
jgi:hypothetical protein